MTMRSTNRLASRVSIWSSTRPRLAAVVALASGSLLLGSVGCVSRGSDAVSVAQVAVRANPDLELLATDERQAVLTVRVKRTGKVLTVRADDVVAGSAFRDLDTATAPAQPAATAPQPAQAPTPAREAEVSTPGARVSVDRRSGESKKRPTAAAVESDTSRDPKPEASAGSASVDRAARPPVASTEQATTPPPAKSVPPQAPSKQPGANIDESALQKRTDPVRCISSETVRLDGVLLQADRVAVQAIGKCNIRITNSHVIGHAALQIAGDATVTVENSIIEGDPAIRVAQTAAIEVHSSTIRGRVQKLQSATVRDLGDNVWR
jgi:hypothetical protein